MREADPEARRLIGEAVDLERARWPASMGAYGDRLLALAVRCEHRAGKAEVHRWFLASAGGALQVRDEVMRECLTDALHEMVGSVSGLLLRFRAGLDRAKRPNLKSMLVRWVTWRAGDLFESMHGRHARRVGPVFGSERVSTGRSPFAVCHARQVCRRLVDDGSPAAWALLMVAQGETVAEAARRAGVSRQALYRLRDALKRDG